MGAIMFKNAQMRAIGAVVVAWAAVCVAQGSGDVETVVLDGVAAHVNDHVVTVGDVLVAIQPIQRQYSRTYSREKLQEKLREAFAAALDSVVERNLILDAYEARGLQLPDWVVDNRVNEIIHERFNGDKSEFLASLAEDRLTYDEWIEEVRSRMIVSYMRGANVEQQVRVSPRDIRVAYDARLTEYRQPAKVRVRMVVVKKSVDGVSSKTQRRKAEYVMGRIRLGDDFGVLARTESEGDKAGEGGDWGWIEPKMLRSELARALSALKPGEVSDLIETREEFYIVKVEGRKDETVVPFADVRGDIERELERVKADEAYAAWVARLKGQSYVKVFDTNPF